MFRLESYSIYSSKSTTDGGLQLLYAPSCLLPHCFGSKFNFYGALKFSVSSNLTFPSLPMLAKLSRVGVSIAEGVELL